MVVLLTCVTVYLLWGILIGVVNAKMQDLPWWSVLIFMFVWFPVAMGAEVKIGRVKISRGDEG